LNDKVNKEKRLNREYGVLGHTKKIETAFSPKMPTYLLDIIG
jgi:hypothetical protein